MKTALVVLLFAAGCGTNPSGIDTVRAKCATSADSPADQEAGVDLAISLIRTVQDEGATKGEALVFMEACDTAPNSGARFDCQVCIGAILDFVYP